MAQADDSRADSPRVDDGPPSSESPPALPTAPPPVQPSPESHTPAPEPSRLGALGLTAAIALACGLAGAYGYERFFAPAPEPVAVAADTRPAAETTATRPAGASISPREEADRLDALSQRVEKLQKQLDAQTRSGPPPEVAALQVRVADLTDSTNTLASLPGKVDHLGNRVNELAGSLNAISGDVASIQSRYGPTTRLASSGSVSRATRSPGDDSSPPTTTPTPLPDHRRNNPDSGKASAVLADTKALSPGADLFRRGRYKEARDAFNALEIRYPDDARVWYYAALSFGFSTSDWTDGAVRLVEKGIAREEAGTPAPAVIDAEFQTLNSSTGKDWLAAYRKRVSNSGQ